MRRRAGDVGEQRGEQLDPRVPEEPCCFPHAALLIEAILVVDVQPSRLAEVQRAVVVPLELEMVAQTASPRTAAGRVARALRRT
ncbi:MAG: hypothetical protein JWN67_3461 [Actinomycetia bacterium]|nr:hypothetical protein [Actinomycetes bacterium]